MKKRLTIGSTVKKRCRRRLFFIPPTRPPARYWLKSPPAAKPKINRAVAAAKEAFPKWANLPMKERARLMRRTGI